MNRARAKRWAATAVAVLLMSTASQGGCPGPRPVAERPPPRVNPVEGLAAQLADADWQRRADAARKLGATRHADAVAPLAGAVLDKDVRVRVAVVQACGAHGSLKLIPALKKGLADKARKVRIHAVRGLGRVGTREAAEAMIETLDGASMWLRPEVADALAKLPAKVISGLEVAIQILVAELDPAQKPRLRRLAKGMAAIGEPALDGLLRAMYRPVGPLAKKKKYVPSDIECRRGPCQVLVTMGAKVLPTLLRMAKDGVQGLSRWNLYRVLLPPIFGRIGKAAIPHVIALLSKSGDPSSLAESTLSKMGVAAVRPLVRLLRKRGQTPRVRAAVARMLGKIRGKRAIAVLLEALKDPDRVVYEAAAAVLAAKPNAKIFTALAKRIKSGPKTQRLAIVRGARHAKGELATRLLLLTLVQSEVDVALRAAQALGKRRDKRAVPALIAALKKPPPKMHLAAVKALGRIGDKRATAALVRVARARGVLALRQAAVRALGLLKDPKAYKTLARLARRGKKALRLAAIGALGELGTKPAKKLLKRLKRSRDKAIAKAAADALDPGSPGKYGFAKTGVLECDKYLRAAACYIGKTPAVARGPSIAAFRKTFQAWKTMAAGPARAMLGKACRMAMEAWKKAVSKIPKYKSCFKP